MSSAAMRLHSKLAFVLLGAALSAYTAFSLSVLRTHGATVADMEAHSQFVAGTRLLHQAADAEARLRFLECLRRDEGYTPCYRGLSTACDRLGLIEESARAFAAYHRGRSSQAAALGLSSAQPWQERLNPYHDDTPRIREKVGRLRGHWQRRLLHEVH